MWPCFFTRSVLGIRIYGINYIIFMMGMQNVSRKKQKKEPPCLCTAALPLDAIYNRRKCVRSISEFALDLVLERLCAGETALIECLDECRLID